MGESVDEEWRVPLERERHPIHKYAAALRRMQEEANRAANEAPPSRRGGDSSRRHLTWEAASGWSSAIQRDVPHAPSSADQEPNEREREHARAWLAIERVNESRALERAVERADRRHSIRAARRRALLRPGSAESRSGRSPPPHAELWATLRLEATGESVHCDSTGKHEVWDWVGSDAEEQQVLVALHTLRVWARDGREGQLRQQATLDDRLQIMTAEEQELEALVGDYRRLQRNGLRREAAGLRAEIVRRAAEAKAWAKEQSVGPRMLEEAELTRILREAQARGRDLPGLD